MSLGFSVRSLRYSLIAGSILPRATNFSAVWTICSRCKAMSGVPLRHPGQHGAVGQAVDRTGSVGLERLQMLRDTVALVRGEAVLRKRVMKLDHVAVALDLGDDRGAGDRVADRVAADERQAGEALAGEHDGVDQRAVRSRAELRQGLHHGEARGFQDIDA